MRRRNRIKGRSFYSFHIGEIGKNFMLLDLQGVSYLLRDPEIVTIDLWVKEGDTKNEFSFCLGNLSTNAIHGFMVTHKCNRICRTLGFKEFENKVV